MSTAEKPDLAGLTDEELSQEHAKMKTRLSRNLKSESSSGFSASKEDYANVVAYFNAIVAEMRLRGILEPRVRRVWSISGSF